MKADKLFQDGLSLLLELNVQQIPEHVVDTLWRGEDQADDYVLQVEIPREGLIEELKETFEKLKKENTSSSFWNYISERNFPYKNLIAWVHQLIGEKDELSFLVSSLYTLMLQLPGSSAYHVFHPFVFRTLLNVLKIWKILNVAGMFW